MKYINVPPDAHRLNLGRRGENLARTLVFDLGDWLRVYGEGTVALLHQRAMDEAPYPCAIEQDGGEVRWAITAADTAQAGQGRMELRYYVGDTLAKSGVYLTGVTTALSDDTAEPPEAQQGWVDEVLAAAKVAATPSDWAVNDPDDPAYVRNRPFYRTAKTTQVLLIEEQTVTTVYDELEEGNVAILPIAVTLTAGELYRVVFDGVAYDCVANASAPKLGDFTFEAYPFWLVDDILGTAQPGDHTFALYGCTTEYEYVTIPKAYLPDITAEDVGALPDTTARIELAVTFADGTTGTYALYGEAVTE